MSWCCQFCIYNDQHLTFFSSFTCQLSQKGSLPVDGQAATPASVSSAEASSQQVLSDVTATLEPKAEHEEEEDEADEEESMTGGRTGIKGEIKIEVNPKVKSETGLMCQAIKYMFPML